MAGANPHFYAFGPWACSLEERGLEEQREAAAVDDVARRSEPSESRGPAVRLFEVGICHRPSIQLPLASSGK